MKINNELIAKAKAIAEHGGTISNAGLLALVIECEKMRCRINRLEEIKCELQTIIDNESEVIADQSGPLRNT